MQRQKQLHCGDKAEVDAEAPNLVTNLDELYIWLFAITCTGCCYDLSFRTRSSNQKLAYLKCKIINLELLSCV